MNAFDALLGKFGAIVSGFGELLFGAVSRNSPTMRGVLRAFGRGVREALKDFGDIAGHGEIDGAGVVIPVEMDPAINLGVPVDGKLVVRGESGNQVFDVRLIGVLDTKVIDGKSEHDGVGLVLEKPVRVAGGMVAGGGELGQECIVGDTTGLGQAVHTFTDSKINMTIMRILS